MLCVSKAQGLANLLRCLLDLKDPLNNVSGDSSASPGGRDLGLGLVDTASVQLARYPGDGRGYVRHRDTPGSALESEEAERKVGFAVVYGAFAPF